ncbi:MAG: DNA polymerase III subunit delta [Leptospirales bacterium]|nr:DNA polymerase III subunit delta [Leptospirales bacterium]
MAFVKYPNSNSLKNEIAKKNLKPLYLFLGPEEGEKDKFIADISSILFKNNPLAKESTGRFHCENGEINEAAGFALLNSMFSQTKLCVLYNIDTIAAADKKTAEEIINGLPPGTTLIATSVKNQPPAVLSNALLKKIEVVQFWRRFDNDIHKYIMAALKKHGYDAAPDVLNIIAANNNNDIRKIDETLEILISSAGEKIIGAEFVMSIISDNSEASVFDFTDALFQKNKKAPAYYKKLIDEGESEQRIFNMILREISLLEKYYIAESETGSITEALERCGIVKKHQDKFLNITRHFNKEKLGEIYSLAMKADYKRKSANRRGLMSDPIMSFINGIIFSDASQ